MASRSVSPASVTVAIARNRSGAALFASRASIVAVSVNAGAALVFSARALDAFNTKTAGQS